MQKKLLASADPEPSAKDDWKSLITACFSPQDCMFARNAEGQASAYRLLGALREQAIGWETAKSEIRAVLTARGASEIQVMRQLKRAETRLRPWLDEMADGWQPPAR